jgi:hypothetical protein
VAKKKKQRNGKPLQEEMPDIESEIASVDGIGSILSGSRAAQIAHTSSSMGFEPRSTHDAFVVSYTKPYAMGSNRVAQATAQFDKCMGGLEHAQLRGFSITVTAWRPAEPEAVRDLAPEVMREDLLNYIEKLGGQGIDSPAALVMVRCDSCHKEVPEFIKWRKSRLCRSCFQRKVGGAPI